MVAKTFLVVVILLIGMQGISCAEPSAYIDQKGMVVTRSTSVEIFITDWCRYCTQAVEFLRQNNVPYVAYDIEKDKSAARRKEQLSGRRGVPFAIINGKKIQGFSEEAYSRLLGLK